MRALSFVLLLLVPLVAVSQTKGKAETKRTGESASTDWRSKADIKSLSDETRDILFDDSGSLSEDEAILLSKEYARLLEMKRSEAAGETQHVIVDKNLVPEAVLFCAIILIDDDIALGVTREEGVRIPKKDFQLIATDIMETFERYPENHRLQMSLDYVYVWIEHSTSGTIVSFSRTSSLKEGE
ncbi:hypothetical protein O71_15740 [Pontibacter sp. BAB1700]|nr:hypothetical protein O71_15740 [Pontibacter sp. BAB1700]